MSRADTFPEATADEIAAAVAAFWDFSGAFPVPRSPIVCPYCGGRAQIREYRVQTRGGTNTERRHTNRMPWRVDIGWKCHVCSLTFNFSPAITVEQGRRMTGRRDDSGRHVGWREAFAELTADPPDTWKAPH